MRHGCINLLVVLWSVTAAAAPYTIELPDGPPVMSAAQVLGTAAVDPTTAALATAVPIIPDRPATVGEYLDRIEALMTARPAEEQARQMGTRADREALHVHLYETYTIDVPEGIEPPPGAVPHTPSIAHWHFDKNFGVIPEDPLWFSWGNTQSKFPQVWGITKGGGITLGVFDDGIYNLHPDLTHAACGNPKACRIYTHGTQVTSVMAALANNFAMVGGAPESALVVYGEDPDTEGTDATLMYVDQVQNRVRPRALNISRTTTSAEMLTYLQLLYMSGILPVVSAGNDNGFPIVYPPAALYFPLVVGGASEQGDWWTGSSSGPQVNVIAHATNAFTDIYPDQTIFQQSGTSFASPVAAAAVGLVDSLDWNLGVYATAQLIKHSATLPRNFPNGAGPNIASGWGIVNVADAINHSRWLVANDWGYNIRNGTYTQNGVTELIDADHEMHLDWSIPNMVGIYQRNDGRQVYRGAILRLPIAQGSGSMSVYAWPRTWCNWHVHHQELDLAPDDGQWVELDVSGCLAYPSTSFVIYRSGDGPTPMRVNTIESGRMADLRIVPCQGCGVCSGAGVYEANGQLVPVMLILTLYLSGRMILARWWPRQRSTRH